MVSLVEVDSKLVPPKSPPPTVYPAPSPSSAARLTAKSVWAVIFTPIALKAPSVRVTEPLVKLIVTDWLMEPVAVVPESLSTNKDPPDFVTLVEIVMLVNVPNDVSNLLNVRGVLLVGTNEKFCVWVMVAAVLKPVRAVPSASVSNVFNFRGCLCFGGRFLT